MKKIIYTCDICGKKLPSYEPEKIILPVYWGYK